MTTEARTSQPQTAQSRFAAALQPVLGPLGMGVKWLRRVHASPAGYAIDLLAIAIVWMLLSVFLNVRYPQKIQARTVFFVSLEFGVLFALFALVRRLGWRIRGWAIAALVVFLLLVRLFLTADSVAHAFLYRRFRVPLDVHLVPDFFSLLYDTSPARKLIGYGAALSAAVLVSVAVLFALLSFMGRSLGHPRFRRVFLACFGVVIAGALAHEFAGAPRVATAAVGQRVGKEFIDFTQLPRERRRIIESVRATQRRIGVGERLDKLEGSNVFLIFVESYGSTVFNRPEHLERLTPRYEEMQRDLEKRGFHLASNFVTSPTYGGFSWFAHASLNTGFKVISHQHSQILEELSPPALANYFRDAGYHPILAAPGTTRPWPGQDDHYGIHHHYYGWEYGYRGPRYGFAPMADQFVMDYIYRKEIRRSTQPLFIQFTLTCSHAPFDNIPRYVNDWSRLGNGASLHRMRRSRFKVGWATGENVAEAYTTAVSYELDVIQGFLEKYVRDDTLVMFLGDHQPHQGVTGSKNLSWSVPMHVVSRNPDFVEPFVRRGYVRGMIPTQPMPHVGMERFLEEFLSDFSTEPLAVEPGIWPPARKHLAKTQAAEDLPPETKTAEAQP